MIATGFRRSPGLILLGSLVLSGAAPVAAQDVPAAAKPAEAAHLFGRENLVAWCIVPFDARKRGPEERAAMLRDLGFRRFAYDWRPEHVPTFDAEVEALVRHGITLDAFWAPGELNDDTRRILSTLDRHHIHAQLWVMLGLGADRVAGAEQERRVDEAVARLRPLAEAAGKVGCSVALYNHGGWFGEPENQVAIVERLKSAGVPNVGIVYNFHHGHDHLDRFAEVLALMRPHLVALNLNGMDRGGDRVGRKILPLGQGALDLDLLRTIRAGYRGPIGILGHTDDDAEARLRDNLEGLDWLVAQLDGKPAGPRPVPRTHVPPAPPAPLGHGHMPLASEGDRIRISALLGEARTHGDPRRGAAVFADAKSACLNCHKVGAQGGTIGPEMTTAGATIPPEVLVESILWPRRKVKEGYANFRIASRDGVVRQGYRQSETDAEIELRDPATGDRSRIAKADVEATKDEGTLMPEGLVEAMSPSDLRDLVRFLLDLGRPEGKAAALAMDHASHAPAEFAWDRVPLRPADWPHWESRINRDRVYDFYTKEAEHFLKLPGATFLPAHPELDGGKQGHWGNQKESDWVDDRWTRTDLGTVLSGVFRGGGVTVPKGVCVRLGDRGEVSACFNPETLCYEAAWAGGFVKVTPKRYGLMDGLLLDGTPLPRPAGTRPAVPFLYRGFYRHGGRVVFAYRLGDVEMLDAPWVEDGQFTRVVAPAAEHPLARMTRGGPARWPQVFATRGTVGKAGPYAIDSIAPPSENPWNALFFFGDHDFLPDGTAFLCTVQGDVWMVKGIDAELRNVTWKRFASGLHQALGLVVADGTPYVLGRDQITRLHDLDGDGEADFYECFSNAFATSPAGHDFICGLQRDAAGRFYTVAGNGGVLRITADGRTSESIAAGFRNPDGIGLGPDGTITVPSSEGEWTPASMISQIRLGGFYGYGGPRKNATPDLPLVYLPRGLDNSSGGQVFAASDRFGPLGNQLLHLSFGAGSYFLVLRDPDAGQPQGAVVPMPGEFLSGSHRGRMNPADGQLYVSGMNGWGSYTVNDGCFQRVRYTGEPAQVPTSIRIRENGVLLGFNLPIDRSIAEHPDRHLAQAWNYRYAANYGSPELSPRHPGTPGHDRWAIRSSHILDDGKTLFLEIPDIQPVNTLHLHVRPDSGPPVEVFATVHKLAAPYTEFPGYTAESKTVAAHPILADMIALTRVPPPNPHRGRIAGSRVVTIEAGKNLTYSLKSFSVKPGEAIRLTFINPDVVPHNWALAKPGSLARVGDLANKIIADPDAALRRYIPRTDDVLAFTDIAEPGSQTDISFVAPAAPGRYPYLCTFPGHWMVMNGEMIVE